MMMGRTKHLEELVSVVRFGRRSLQRLQKGDVLLV
jgi:hypothetical protein